MWKIDLNLRLPIFDNFIEGSIEEEPSRDSTSYISCHISYL